MTSSVIITVVVVLGIIVAGGFLIYFLGDLIMSLAHKNKDDDTVKNKQIQRTKELEERVNALENSQAAKNDPEIAQILYNGAVVESYNPEEDLAEEAEEAEETLEEPEEEPAQEETVETPAEEPVEEETEEDDEASEYIKKRRQELMDRLARMQSEEEEEETETPTEEEGLVDIEETPAEEETVEEPVEETTTETVEEPVEDTEEETEESEEVAPAPTNVVAEVKFEAAKAEDASLASTMSLEELEAQLAAEQEKLKVNEKELRQCKKEYIPLRKVKKTLENDEKKLRRKEALVAKQKVVLYGVNNYSEIDSEKAQKLAEDLDLLDGLKLSVQHCEEVMSKNEERYPLLEKIYNLLSSQNTEIKDDIAKLQSAIDELKAQGDNTDAE